MNNKKKNSVLKEAWMYGAEYAAYTIFKQLDIAAEQGDKAYAENQSAVDGSIIRSICTQIAEEWYLKRWKHNTSIELFERWTELTDEEAPPEPTAVESFLVRRELKEMAKRNGGPTIIFFNSGPDI